MEGIRHIFFDLDNTLWDFERNSAETLKELFEKYRLHELGVTSLETFVAAYKHRNELMWEGYRLGTIDKPTLRDKRFEFTFWDLGIDPELAPRGLAEDYVNLGPRRKNLFPHAHEILGYLQKRYTLHIITNGFEEAQHIKLEASDLYKYFSEIVISEHTGYRKPDVRIFRHSMEKAGATEKQCLMIGDGLEVDILGAQAAGWRTIYFNPQELPHKEKPDHEIRSLDELERIL